MSLYPYPDGWYAIGFAHELRPGQVMTCPFMGQDVVVFRTQSGQVCAVDPFCPHLGAHFGHGGTVQGETIQCPFHDFRFNTSGMCVATAYGTKPPPTAIVRTWPVREVDGVIIVYHHHDGQPPAWEVPTHDFTGWGPLVTRQWTLRSHPQETSENSVDTGHLVVVHSYHNVQILREPTADGPLFTARYAMTRPMTFLGRQMVAVSTEFDVYVHGLGYSVVEVHIPAYDIRTRQFVLATPIDDEHIILRIALSMDKRSGPARYHPLLARLMTGAAFNAFAHDVAQDFVIWEHKRYMQPPALALGDGPIGRYRQWAKQFYD